MSPPQQRAQRRHHGAPPSCNTAAWRSSSPFSCLQMRRTSSSTPHAAHSASRASSYFCAYYASSCWRGRASQAAPLRLCPADPPELVPNAPRPADTTAASSSGDGSGSSSSAPLPPYWARRSFSPSAPAISLQRRAHRLLRTPPDAAPRARGRKWRARCGVRVRRYREGGRPESHA